MKKLATFLLMLVTVVSLSGCQQINILEKAFENMAETESGELTLEIYGRDNTLNENISVVIDGSYNTNKDKAYMQMFFAANGIEMESEMIYSEGKALVMNPELPNTYSEIDVDLNQVTDGYDTDNSFSEEDWAFLKEIIKKIY